MVSIQGRCLFKGGVYSRVVSIQGWCLFNGVVYSRVVSIQGRGVYSFLSAVLNLTTDHLPQLGVMVVAYLYAISFFHQPFQPQ